MNYFYSWFILFFIPFLMSCSSSTNTAQGYVEGEYIYMASPVSGVLKTWRVRKGEWVNAKQLLAVLATEPESDRYQKAVADLNQAKAAHEALLARLKYAKTTYERQQVLYRKGAIQLAILDNAESTYQAMRAEVLQTNAAIFSRAAQLAEADWHKNQKNLVAPKSAIVFDRYYREGEYTIANEPILALLAPTDIKVIFYLSAAQLRLIRLNDEVRVIPFDSKISFTGHIYFISPSAEYTPPFIYSNETNAKLIYRIEAKFPQNQALQLHPGQPVTVSYHFHD